MKADGTRFPTRAENGATGPDVDTGPFSSPGRIGRRWRQPRPRIACVFHTEWGLPDLDVEAVFIRFEEARRSRLILNFASIPIHDAEHGDLAYPVAALPAEAGAGEVEGPAPPHDGNP